MSAHRRKPVVVAVDGSRTFLATVDVGVAEAIRHHAPLLIVHAWPGRYLGPVQKFGAASAATQGQRLLDLAARRAEHLAPHLDITTELLEGAASTVVVQRSAIARRLVIGHRDESLTRPSWGSTAAYLAHHSACPLLVHRGAAPGKGPVVLAASARRPATSTVICAFEEAALRHAPLVAIHVWASPYAEDSTPAPMQPGYIADRQRAERRIAEALTEPCAANPEVAVEQLALHDLDIAYTVERAARRGRLLVAGMGRHGRLPELLYSSFGQNLTRRAPCPVLLVPPGWHGREDDTPGAGLLQPAPADRTYRPAGAG